MNDKTSNQTAVVSLSQPQEKSTEISSSWSEVQVTEATGCRNQFLEINVINRAKAAQTLRAIAHLLMSGSLSILVAIAAGVSCSINGDEPNSIWTEDRLEDSRT